VEIKLFGILFVILVQIQNKIAKHLEKFAKL